MDIQQASGDKWRYRDLLLPADEQEDMIGRYLHRGTVPAPFPFTGPAALRRATGQRTFLPTITTTPLLRMEFC